ncbi:hypothetical protein FRC20_010898 [Serendipita sp. 405]|nr:hypothetical protein FRC20_010898 [Serendipita sp. 405]
MDLTPLITAVSHAKITQYVSGVGATLYFYDYFLTLGPEVELFWNSKGGRPLRLLVIAIRYFPILGFPIGLLASNPLVSSLSTSTAIESFPSNSCRFSIVGGIIFLSLSGILGTALFTMRVSTLYESRPRVQLFVRTVFWITAVAHTATSAVALSILHPRIGATEHHCAVVIPISRKQTYIIGSTYIVGLPCEAVILAATIYHALDSRRVVLGTSAAWPILRRLYTDGAFWFAIAFSLRLLGCLQWVFCPEDLKNFGDYLVYALQTIVASRFFLALRRRICNSATSTSNGLHISHSHKVTVGAGSKVRYSFSPPVGTLPATGGRHGADDQHILTLVTPTTPVPASAPAYVHSRSHSHSHFQQHPSWMPPSFTVTVTREVSQPHSHSRPYSVITPDGEEIQMTAVSAREYDLEATASKEDKPTVQSMDVPLYDLEACRTDSDLKGVLPNVSVGDPPSM